LKLKTNVLLFGIIILTGIMLLIPSNTSATSEPSEEITITPIDDKISLEKRIATMHIPENKSFVWGTVKGEPSDYVERYPVIIQFFKGEEPIHVAQVKVKGDGSYEYKFRIRNVDQTTGEVFDIFHGEYTVKMFKVIHTK
jgi:hypothetical protein